MYFTTANPVPGPLLANPVGHASKPIGALVLALLLAAVAAPSHAAPLLQEAAEAPKAAPSKPRNAKQRSKNAASKVTVTAAATADKVAPPAPVPAAGGERWDIVIADRTLNAAMARWAAAAGWQLLWELPVDYAVQAHTSVPGSFENAVTQVVNSMEGAEIPMKAVFYSGNKVLRIMAKGAQ